MPACDVLICGAGASGLTLAIDLARRGIGFRIIDASPVPFHGSRGKGIQPRTQEVFEDLGILDQLMAAGGPYPPVRHYEGESFKEAPFAPEVLPTSQEPYGQLLMLAQFRAEAILRGRLAELGYVVEFGHELVGFEQTHELVAADIRDGASVGREQFAYLVGADGGRSFVRDRLEIPFTGETKAVRSIVADVDVAGLEPEYWHRWGKVPEDILMISPLRGTEIFQLQAPISLEEEADLSVEGLNKLIKQRSGRDDIEVRSVAWSSAYGTNLRVADRFREGRVFLVGDAAHVHPPTGGQGLNTSVQDAYNLGWKLAAVLGGASEALLDTYDAERRAVAAGVIQLSGRLLDSLRSKGEMTRGRDNHQLDLNYRGSALARDHDARERRVMAGDRAPDAICFHAGGPRCRLFDIFAGPHWTLLAFEPGALDLPRGYVDVRVRGIGGEEELRDADREIEQAYDLTPGDWVLIRPDGYVGATGRGDPVQALCEIGLRKLQCH